MANGNRKLKALFKLSHKVSVYIPSNSQGMGFDNTVQVDRALTFLASECGGSTSTQAVGCWLSVAGGLVKENVTLVFAYRKDLDTTFVDKLVDYALNLREELHQESVAVEVDGEMYFV